MSDITPTGSSTPSTAETPSSPTSTSSTTGSSGSGDSGYSSNTTVGSISELQQKAPQVYQAMMEGLAMNIVGKMRDDQARLKKIMKEGERAFSG
ncbi:MAG: hypothetical protein ACSNEK_02050 [Parachlamydiaceae bacterium]